MSIIKLTGGRCWKRRSPEGPIKKTIQQVVGKKKAVSLLWEGEWGCELIREGEVCSDVPTAGHSGRHQRGKGDRRGRLEFEEWDL